MSESAVLYAAEGGLPLADAPAPEAVPAAGSLPPLRCA